MQLGRNLVTLRLFGSFQTTHLASLVPRPIPAIRVRWRPGTQRDSAKAWHKMAKKVPDQREKVPEIARRKSAFLL